MTGPIVLDIDAPVASLLAAVVEDGRTGDRPRPSTAELARRTLDRDGRVGVAASTIAGYRTAGGRVSVERLAALALASGKRLELRLL